MASRAGSSSAPGGGGPSATPARSPAAAAAAVTAKSTSDPILRNALRYTISAREYALLHKYVISRSRVLKKRAPSVDAVQRMMEGDAAAGAAAGGRGRAQSLGNNGKGKGKASVKGREGDREAAKGGADNYNARAIRHSLRVFIATGALMKLWGLASASLMGKKQE